MAESKIVSAVMVSANSGGGLAGSGNKMLGKAIEKAMSEAILKCNAEGISTSDENSGVIRAAMMEARERVLGEYREWMLQQAAGTDNAI